MTLKENMGKVWEKLTSIPFMILVIFLVAVFVGIAYYIYQNYVKPKGEFTTNREIIQEETSNKSAMLVILYADWCPHSKSVMNNSDKEEEGGWYKLKQNFQNPESELRLINNYALTLQEINESDKKAIAEFEETYKKEIGEFPSIFLIKDDQVIEFNATPSESNFEKFLNDVL